MNSKLKHFSLLFLFALLIFYPALRHLYVDIDEVLWAEFAHAVLNACPPYVCVIGEKPPLLYLTYAAIFKLFGINNYFALHLVHIFWVTLTAFLINLVWQRESQSLLLGEKKCESIFPVGRMRGGLFTLLPGLLYILLFALPEFRTLAATGESFMNLFLVASFYFFIKDKENKNWLLIGIFVGLASLYRHQAAIQLFVYIFVLLREIKTEKIKFLLSLLFGFSLTWLAMSALLYFWGSWPAFWEWGILHNFGYIQNGAKAPGVWLTALENLGLFFGKTIVFWLLSFSILFPSPHAGEGPQRGGEGAISLYLLTALLAACPGFRFFPHYFIQTFPPLALLATLALQRIDLLHKSANDPSSRRGGSKVTQFATANEDILEAATPKLERAAIYARGLMKFPLWAKTGLLLSLLLALFQNATISNALEEDSTKDYSSLNKKVGEYIQQHTSPENKILVWGWGQGIYAYANRRMGTRYIASDFLTGRIPASDAKLYTSIEEAQKFIHPQAWDHFFEELEKNKPVYFIDTAPANIHDYERFPPEAYPKLLTFLNKNYFLETEIEKIKLYRRKQVSLIPQFIPLSPGGRELSK